MTEESFVPTSIHIGTHIGVRRFTRALICIYVSQMCVFNACTTHQSLDTRPFTLYFLLNNLNLSPLNLNLTYNLPLPFTIFPVSVTICSLLLNLTFYHLPPSFSPRFLPLSLTPTFFTPSYHIHTFPPPLLHPLPTPALGLE